MWGFFQQSPIQHFINLYYYRLSNILVNKNRFDTYYDRNYPKLLCLIFTSGCLNPWIQFPIISWGCFSVAILVSLDSISIIPPTFLSSVIFNSCFYPCTFLWSFMSKHDTTSWKSTKGTRINTIYMTSDSID